MPSKSGKLLYKVFLKRRGLKNISLHTHAYSVDQAKHNAQIRKRGFTAYRAVVK